MTALSVQQPRERPIIFSSPMVRAILDGRKTQTRRQIKPQPVEIDGRILAWRGGLFQPKALPENSNIFQHCPYGVVGDRLWVRETWASLSAGNRPPFVYRADGDGERVRVDAPWRPSIHMPRWASRITLEITDVRVQRLQEISDEDARAEGWPGNPEPPYGCHHPRLWFRNLWKDIHDCGAWERNDWVWALTFRRVTS